MGKTVMLFTGDINLMNVTDPAAPFKQVNEALLANAKKLRVCFSVWDGCAYFTHMCVLKGYGAIYSLRNE